MGKTNQPLKLLVHPDIADHPLIVALADKGHFIHSEPGPGTALERYDGVLGPTCWRMDESLLDEKLLDVALKAIRAAKKAHVTK